MIASPMTDDARDGSLAGIRVVDFGQWLAGPLVAAWLADAGADVIRVDPPGGPRWKSSANAMLQRGKRSIVLDLSDDGDLDTARALIARADVVIENFRPGVMSRLGLEPAASMKSNPGLLWCSLPGFGAEDPRAQMPAWEGVVNAAAGIYLRPGCTPMNYVGDRDRDPTFSAIPVASSYGAFVAAHSIIAGLIARERNGVGQHIEVSLFDACFELIGASVMQVENPTPPAGPPMSANLPQLGHYRCGDGNWLELCLFQDKHLRWFAETFLPTECIDDGMADPVRMLTDPELQKQARQTYSDLFATRTAREWERAINDESGASAALCQTAEQWLKEDTHARESGAVVEVDDPEFGSIAQAGYPIAMSLTPLRVQFPRHELNSDREDILRELEIPSPVVAGYHEASDIVRPLEGIRVIDLAQVLAGPTVSRILAEYGADVIKIHNPGDRQLGMHLYTNSGKRSIMVDLKKPEGLEIFERLTADADVVVQNFTRGVADRMGVGEESIRRRNPDVVYASISAFGHEGYRGGWRGREQLGQGPTGMQSRLGGDGAPMMAPYPYNDYGSGNLAAFAVLLALFARMRGTQGQHVQSSLVHCGTFLQIPFMVAEPGRVWDEPAGQEVKGWSEHDRLYGASDGWMYVKAPQGFDTVSELAGLDTGGLEAAFKRESAGYWSARLGVFGIGAQQLADLPGLMDDPIVRARGLSIERVHEGTGRVRMAGPSARLSRTPAVLTSPVGSPGSDTRDVLEENGFDADDLVRRGIAFDGLPDGTQFIGMFR